MTDNAGIPSGPQGDDDDKDAQDTRNDARIVTRKPSQAVVIVHGMGEQRPMETIRSFAQAVWNADLSLTEGLFNRRKPDPDGPGEINKSWISPDSRAKSYELRRITTPYDVHGRRTDFYELYWSDITQGTTLEWLKAWVTSLLLRKWSDVPRDARSLYVVAWVAVFLIVAPTVVLAVMKCFNQDVLIWPGWVWTIAAALVTALITGFMVPYFGDVAIYVQAQPGTIAKRQEVRERGLTLLRTLTEDPAYDRIVLVAHSLGTIVAYDLLQILWTECGPSPLNPRQEAEVLDALREVGKKALPVDAKTRAGIVMQSAELAEFRALQWRAYTELRKQPSKQVKPWKVSDFVTFGSPLTHAEFLVTHNAADFNRGVDERLFSICPPVSETKRPTVLYKDRQMQQHPHHAAVFAATRWTNIFDKGNGWLTGDPISGPLTENFGPGVENVQVKLHWGLGRIFTHTQYWSLKATGQEAPGQTKPRDHLQVLRDAVDLERKLEP